MEQSVLFKTCLIIDLIHFELSQSLTMSAPAPNPVLMRSAPAFIPVLSATVLAMSAPASTTLTEMTQNQMMTMTAIIVEMIAPMMEVHIDALPYFLASSIRLSAAALDDTTENIHLTYETLFDNVIFYFSTCIGGNIYE